MTCPFCGELGERSLTGIADKVAVVFCPACNVVFVGLPDNKGKWVRHPTFGDPWRSDKNRLGVTRAAA